MTDEFDENLMKMNMNEIRPSVQALMTSTYAHSFIHIFMHTYRELERDRQNKGKAIGPGPVTKMDSADEDQQQLQRDRWAYAKREGSKLLNP
jgi:hypothetical protein